MPLTILNSDELGKRIECPNCGEELFPIDLENYSCCPYCNTEFEQTNEFEDFLLDPVVRHWEERCRQRKMGDAKF